MTKRKVAIDVLHLDFETRSIVDLKRAGVYRYAEDPYTSVICAAYVFNDDDNIEVWKGGKCPPAIVHHIENGGIIHAHNAQFERVIMHHCLEDWPQPALKQWRCTAAMAAALSLPRDLARAAAVVGSSQMKDAVGHRLMLRLSQPKSMAGGKVLWHERGEDLERLYLYCMQDVRTEREISKKLRPLTTEELSVWQLDQTINERGVCIDRAGVHNAKIIVNAAISRLNEKIETATGGAITAISQTEAIKKWCKTKNIDLQLIDKVSLAAALENTTLPKDVRRVLEFRQEGAKSSNAKLHAYQDRVSMDGRMRDNLMYYGANTGRWSGRGAQLQNLPRSKLKDIPGAIETMKLRSQDALSVLYGPPLEIVSECLRGFVVAPADKKLIAGDFSNIEGRVLAWLSNHTSLMADFASGVKIYEAMASAIYSIPASKIEKNSIHRHVGKEAVLAGGFGMGWERFIKQCAKSGLKIDEDLARRTIDTYRVKNKPITDYWDNLEYAAMTAIAHPSSKITVEKTGGAPRQVSFAVHGKILWCRLPSGRLMSYPDPRIMPMETPWGEMKNSVTYMTVDNLTNQWVRDKTYGGKLAENVTSGLARDIMVHAMFNLERAGYEIVLTVHDEIVAEVDKTFGSSSEMTAIMCEIPAYATGCPIAAEGFEAQRYKK